MKSRATRVERESEPQEFADAPERPPSGASNALLSRYMLQRQGPGHDDWSGPSYARHGPAVSTIEDRRSATGGPRVYAQEVLDDTAKKGLGEVVSGLKTLYKIAEDTEKQAKEGKAFYQRADPDLMALAKQIKDVAKALESLKSGWEKMASKGFDFSTVRVEQEAELPKMADLLKGSMDSIRQGFTTQEAFTNFQAHPNRETANAWATAIGDQFSAGKGIVAALKFVPGTEFIQEYFSGLLDAPKAYISAFQAIASKRYDELDKEANITNDDSKLEDTGPAGGGVVWAGGTALQTLVSQAYTAPNGVELYKWLVKHKKIDGKDMQKIDPKVGKALMIQALQADAAVSETDRTAWVTWLDGYAV
jgi:hypothetical protein